MLCVGLRARHWRHNGEHIGPSSGLLKFVVQRRRWRLIVECAGGSLDRCQAPQKPPWRSGTVAELGRVF